MTLAALVLTVSLTACGPESGGGSSGPGATSVPVATGAAPTGEVRKTFDGYWWVLAPELPVHGLYLSLETTGDSGRWEGSWVAFDWRGTHDPQQLARVTRPVEVSARKDGELMVIVGAVPQVDARGRPTGGDGDWELRVTRSSLPGQPLHYTGHMLHSDTVEGEGVPVELVSTFRAWSR